MAINNRPLKVLMQNRTHAITQPGGDTVVMNETKQGLEKLGIKVVIDLEMKEDPRNYDLVHLFNLATPAYTEFLARRAKAAGVPYVVTTLLEDVPKFHYQSRVWANYLINYVRNEQAQIWAAANKPNLDSVEPCQGFPSAWTVKNAAGLLVTGPKEGDILARDHGPGLPIYPVYLGCEVAKDSTADKFISKYGLKDFVLCVGRLESRKNQLSLLKALEDSEVPVVIASSGFSYQPDYAEAVQKFKRKGQTLVLGRQDPEMLASAYCAAKVHALPSFYELPGLVTLEGAHYGCNVVASRNAGTIEDYLGGDVYYCDPASEVSIRDAVTRALNAPRSPDLKRKAERYTWSRLGEQTLNIYGKVLNLNDSKILEGKGAYMASTFDLDTETTVFQDLMERAEIATKSSKVEEAKSLFAQADKINPNSVRLKMGYGTLCLSIGEVEAARNSFDAALRISPDDARSLIGRGMCEVVNRNHATGYGYFVKALQASPAELVAIHQLIECSFVLNKFDDITTAIERYLLNKPKDSEMRFCLAGCYYKTNRIPAALLQIDLVLEDKPEHRGATELKSQINSEANKIGSGLTQGAAARTASVVMAEPVKSAETLIVAPATPIVTPTIPRNTGIDMLLANINERKRARNLDNIKSECDAIINMRDVAQDQVEYAQILKAEVDIIQGSLEAAAAIYEAVLAANPNQARALCGKAALKANSNSWTEAEALFNSAKASDARCDIAYAGLGMCAAQTGNFPKAWDLYLDALKLNPENLRAVLGVIELGYPMKRLAEVEAAVRGYLELHPADCNFIYSLAGCLFARERYVEAYAELDRLLMFEPENRHALELKEMIIPKLGIRNSTEKVLR